MTVPDIASHRLHHQLISHTPFTKAADVVYALCALQAQDYAGAKWTVGLRLPGATDESVEKAIDDASIVRTWALRSTLHLVAAKDIRWILSAVAPRALEKGMPLFKKAGYDAKLFKRSATLLARILRDGQHHTRQEVKDILEKQLGVAQKENYILIHAALSGLICLGPRRGKEFTYALLDEWVPAAKSLPHEEAKARLAERFFSGHGPATQQDFVWWSGFTIAEAKAAMDAVRSRFVQADVAGVTYWLPGTAASVPKNSGVYLLPGFDEYMFGYTDRSLIVTPRDYKKISGTGNGLFASTLIVGGRVAGRWKRTLEKENVLIELEPFAPLTAVQKKNAMAAARRYADFVQLKLKTKGF